MVKKEYGAFVWGLIYRGIIVGGLLYRELIVRRLLSGWLLCGCFCRGLLSGGFLSGAFCRWAFDLDSFFNNSNVLYVVEVFLDIKCKKLSEGYVNTELASKSLKFVQSTRKM